MKLEIQFLYTFCRKFSWYDKSIIIGIVHLTNFFDFLWTSFIAFFGGKPTATKIDSKKSYRSIIFISLLSGSIVWIFYRAYLTAELAIRIKKYPINDMESLSKTDWRYGAIHKWRQVFFEDFGPPSPLSEFKNFIKMSDFC